MDLSIFTNQQNMIYILSGICAILLFWIIFIEFRFRKILGKTKKKTLEDAIAHVHHEIKTLHGFEEDVTDYLKTVEHRLRKSIQGIETVRFNPFKGTGGGGNQSFSTAFLNEENNGVVVSGLYSRDRVSIFSKPIKEGKSEFELTNEEKQALKSARSQIQHKS